MTEVPASQPVPAGQAFDAALSRGRAAIADPLPVLPKIDPAKAPARAVAEVRGLLSARFAHAVPAARARELHQSTVRALDRLERRFYWQRLRVEFADFVITYRFAILGLLVAAILAVLAILYREAILAFVGGLRSAPVLPAPSPVQPSMTTPLPSAPGTTVPGGATP